MPIWSCWNWRRGCYNEKEKNSFNYRALDFISKVKRELISENDYNEHTKDENIITLYKSYQDLLRVQNGIDFDDLLFCKLRKTMNSP